MNRISLIVQKLHLEKRFPGSRASTSRNELLNWEHTLTPSSLSNTYKVRVSYNIHGRPEVFVLDPQLSLAAGATILPHVFSHKAQKLCLYRAKKFEWNANQLIVETIVPWTCEWLLHYEIWLSTGVWCGGGEHLDIDTNLKLADEHIENDNSVVLNKPY